MTDFWQGRTADLFDVLEKLNKQGNILQARCFPLLGLFIRNTSTLQRAAGRSEGSISSKSNTEGQGQKGLSPGIKKAIVDLKVNKNPHNIQMRNSISRYWLWKKINAHSHSYYQGIDKEKLLLAIEGNVKPDAQNGLKCTVCTCKAV